MCILSFPVKLPLQEGKLQYAAMYMVVFIIQAERKRDFPFTNLPEITFRGPFPLIQRCELFLTVNTSSKPIKLNRKY